MQTKILGLSDREEWRRYYDTLPSDRKDVYYMPEYYSLYQDYGDGEALCFVFEKDGETALYPFLKNPVTPLGYDLDREYYDIQGAYGYNGLISSSDDKAFIAAFWQAFDSWCRENDVIAEFMRFHPVMRNHLLGEGHFRLIHDRNTVYLDLTRSEEEIFNGFEKSTRKHILRPDRPSRSVPPRIRKRTWRYSTASTGRIWST